MCVYIYIYICIYILCHATYNTDYMLSAQTPPGQRSGMLDAAPAARFSAAAAAAPFELHSQT